MKKEIDKKRILNTTSILVTVFLIGVLMFTIIIMNFYKIYRGTSVFSLYWDFPSSYLILISDFINFAFFIWSIFFVKKIYLALNKKFSYDLANFFSDLLIIVFYFFLFSTIVVG